MKKLKFGKFWQSINNRRLVAATAATIVIIAGLSIVLIRAAGLFTAVEPEKATLQTNATISTDSTAAGGKALQFNAPTSTPPPQTGVCALSTPHVPDGPDGMGGCWPGPSNTGVPSGTTLTPYDGSCTISTANTVIDAKVIDCANSDLLIQAANVTITRSKITGHIVVETDTNRTWSLNLTDSQVIGIGSDQPDRPAIFNGNVNILRANISGGHNGLECQEHSSHCSLKDSWIHDQWQSSTGDTHLGGVAHFGEAVPCSGVATNGMVEVCFDIEHSSIICDAPANKDGGGCTGDINMISHTNYGPLPGAYIYRNLMGANTGAAFCSYGGQGELNGTRIVYIDNVFQRGTNGKCAAYGPINAFKFTNAGNMWTNNKYDDGTVINCTAADECL